MDQRVQAPRTVYCPARAMQNLFMKNGFLFFLDCYELAEMERPFFILKGRLDSNLILRLPFFCNLAPLLESSCTVLHFWRFIHSVQRFSGENWIPDWLLTTQDTRNWSVNRMWCRKVSLFKKDFKARKVVEGGSKAAKSCTGPERPWQMTMKKKLHFLKIAFVSKESIIWVSLLWPRLFSFACHSHRTQRNANHHQFFFRFFLHSYFPAVVSGPLGKSSSL